MKSSIFSDTVENIMALQITHKVGDLGGYGPNGEVIYKKHPRGCPSILVDKQGNATVTFMSNGSLDFKYTSPENGNEVNVLRGHFDPFEKREIGIPSNNIWLADDKGLFFSSIVNPFATGVIPETVKFVKEAKKKSFWYCHTFKINKNITLETAVKYSMVTSDSGPAILRQCYLKNTGKKSFSGFLFGFFDLRGTQLFTYNKEIWYDAGMPFSPRETVCVSLLPYSDKIFIKRISSETSGGITSDSATCDYTEFIGSTASSSFFPAAVLNNHLRDSQKVLNRFSTPTIHARKFKLEIPAGENGEVSTSLLFVSDNAISAEFRSSAQTDLPNYTAISSAFYNASKNLLNATPNVANIAELQNKNFQKENQHPYFMLNLPSQPLVREYANSLWSGIDELYENCRAHGAKLAEGIELGTRDRAQDMWPKMKEDPATVRKDLVHLFSFMYDFNITPVAGEKKLNLIEKLHGMFPRQYPSRWSDRTEEVKNDNRHYADSALWPVDSIVRYITETGDYGILLEKVETVILTYPDNPVVSGIVGNKNSYYIIEVIFAIFASFERHAKDSPYGMAQILYGGWNDPVDMFGTSVIGDPSTRGKGRGTCSSLSAHLFRNIISVLDILEADNIMNGFPGSVTVKPVVSNLKIFADKLRNSIINIAWEDNTECKGFIEYIHELNKDGSVPDYSKGEKGYTLGSMNGFDFDGINRRILTCQAWGLAMISIERQYLSPVAQKENMQHAIAKTLDKIFYDEQLGLKLFSTPVANAKLSLDYVGRIGIIPPGTAENGEYHHAQTIMHLFRMLTPGHDNADSVWKQFKPIISAMKGSTLNGPFETPSTSYASDPEDPHFGAGMYFGLSGSINWIIEIFEQIAGLNLNLYNPDCPDLIIKPALPVVLEKQLGYKRIINYFDNGVFRKIPFSLLIEKKQSKNDSQEITINGKSAKKAEILSLKDVQKVEIIIKM